MKRKRYSTEQIVAAIKQHELGTPAADIIRKLGIAAVAIFRLATLWFAVVIGVIAFAMTESRTKTSRTSTPNA
jgi:uncharacterized membrane protein YbhN (UPF0104 family)